MKEFEKLLYQYRKGINELGSEPLEEMLAHADQSLQQTMLEIAFIGRVAVGKSSLINRLLGRDLLPTGAGAITPKLTFVRRGDSDILRVRLQDGSEEPPTAVTPEAIMSHVKRPEVANLMIELMEFPHDRVTWVDTPGVEDLNDHALDITYGYLPTADAVVFVLDSAQIFTKSELEFYEQRISATHKDKVFLTLNKFDLLDDETNEGFRERVESHLGADLRRHQINVVSSRRGFDQAEGLLATFKADIERYLASCDKRTITRQKVRSLIDRVQLHAMAELDTALEHSGTDLASLRAELERLEAERSEAEQQLNEAQAEITRRVREVSREVMQKYSTFEAAVMGNMESIDIPQGKERVLRQIPSQLRELTSDLKSEFGELRPIKLGRGFDFSVMGQVESLVYRNFGRLDDLLELMSRVTAAPKIASKGLAADGQVAPLDVITSIPSYSDPQAVLRKIFIDTANDAANERLDRTLKNLLRDYGAYLEDSLEALKGPLLEEARLNGMAALEARKNGLEGALAVREADASISAETREHIEQRKERLERLYLDLVGAL